MDPMGKVMFERIYILPVGGKPPEGKTDAYGKDNILDERNLEKPPDLYLMKPKK